MELACRNLYIIYCENRCHARFMVRLLGVNVFITIKETLKFKHWF